MKLFYASSYFLCQSISRLVFHLSLKGRENIPKSGPFIAASNHISYFDPVIIGSLLKQEIAYLAKGELFNQLLLKNLIGKLNAFPVHRGKSDVTSIRTFLHILKEQKMPLLIFPEGTRIKTGKLGVPQRGLAFIAAQAKVPILPIYIENSNHLGSCALFKRRLKVHIGESVPYPEFQHLFEDKKQYSEFAQMVMSRIQRLKEQLRTA